MIPAFPLSLHVQYNMISDSYVLKVVFIVKGSILHMFSLKLNHFRGRQVELAFNFSLYVEVQNLTFFNIV